jgi:serine/threonine-protein kinase HipA
MREELLDFGRRICGVSRPARELDILAQAMQETLQEARSDERIPAPLLTRMRSAWNEGLALAH